MKKMFSLTLCVVVLLALITLVHFKTKESYQAVGFNNGTIDAKLEIIKSINNIVKDIGSCDKFKNDFDLIPIIRVKTKSLYLIKSDNNQIYFCQYN